jgi:hypothetical protein
MSWWLIVIAMFVLLRLTRRCGWERHALGHPRVTRLHGPHGTWPAHRQATSAPAGPPALDRGRTLQRTIDGVVQEYVAGRIGVEEYERRLDELYRTAEGKRLVQGG